MVLKQAATAVYHRIMDGVDPGLVDRVEHVLLATAGVEAVDHLRLRWIGHELRAEAEIVSDSEPEAVRRDALELGDHHAEVAHHLAR